jgi:hypothetical protein
MALARYAAAVNPKSEPRNSKPTRMTNGLNPKHEPSWRSQHSSVAS